MDLVHRVAQRFLQADSLDVEYGSRAKLLVNLRWMYGEMAHYTQERDKLEDQLVSAVEANVENFLHAMDQSSLPADIKHAATTGLHHDLASIHQHVAEYGYPSLDDIRVTMRGLVHRIIPYALKDSKLVREFFVSWSGKELLRTSEAYNVITTKGRAELDRIEHAEFEKGNQVDAILDRIAFERPEDMHETEFNRYVAILQKDRQSADPTLNARKREHFIDAMIKLMKAGHPSQLAMYASKG